MSAPIPGRAGKAIGTGDFNGDGKADILWQNDDGQAAIWEMNGTNLIGRRATVGANPGPSWQAIGAGDFNGDGKCRHPVAERQRPGRDLADERHQRSLGGGALSAPIPGRPGKRSAPATSTATAIPTSCGRTPTATSAIWEMNGTSDHRRRRSSAPIPGRPGKRSAPAISTATANPTSCGRTQTARPRSGR